MTQQQYIYQQNLRRMTLLAARANLAAGYAEDLVTQDVQVVAEAWIEDELASTENPVIIGYVDNMFTTCDEIVVKMSDLSDPFMEADTVNVSTTGKPLLANTYGLTGFVYAAADGSNFTINANKLNLAFGTMMEKSTGTLTFRISKGFSDVITTVDVPYKTDSSLPVWSEGKYQLSMNSLSNPLDLTWNSTTGQYEAMDDACILFKDGYGVKVKFRGDEVYYTYDISNPNLSQYSGTLLASETDGTFDNIDWTLTYVAS